MDPYGEKTEEHNPRDDVKKIHADIQDLDQEGRNQLCAMLREGADADEQTADDLKSSPAPGEDSEEPSGNHGMEDKYMRGPGLTLVIGTP